MSDIHIWTVTITIPLTHLCKTTLSSQNVIKKQPTNSVLWHTLELQLVQEGDPNNQDISSSFPLN